MQLVWFGLFMMPYTGGFMWFIYPNLTGLHYWFLAFCDGLNGREVIMKNMGKLHSCLVWVNYIAVLLPSYLYNNSWELLFMQLKQPQTMATVCTEKQPQTMAINSYILLKADILYPVGLFLCYLWPKGRAFHVLTSSDVKSGGFCKENVFCDTKLVHVKQGCQLPM